MAEIISDEEMADLLEVVKTSNEKVESENPKPEKPNLDATISILTDGSIPENKMKSVFIKTIDKLLAKGIDPETLDLALYTTIMEEKNAIVNEKIDEINESLEEQTESFGHGRY